jgi:hypothetical protein
MCDYRKNGKCTMKDCFATKCPHRVSWINVCTKVGK